MGPNVSPCVLEFLSKTVNSWGDVAEAMLRDIDSDNDVSANSSTSHSSKPSDRLNSADEQAFPGSHHFSDIYILVEMLSVPCLAVEASQTFERAVARGAFVPHSVAMVLERRLAQTLNHHDRLSGDNLQPSEAVAEGDTDELLKVQRDDFTSVLGLAETLALSRDSCVKGFVKILFTLLFKWYTHESYRGRMIKRLVDRATSSTDTTREVDLDLDILVTLTLEEQEMIRPVLSMMREVAELANVDRATLWHQLCASEDEIVRIREESKTEVANVIREKAAISQKLSESEANTSRLKVF